MRRITPAGVFLSVLLLALCFLPPGTAFAADPVGTVRVTIAAPEGIPASVVLSAKATYVAAKPEAGDNATVALKVVPGSYEVIADSMTIDGRYYVATSSRPEVPVKAGRTTDLKVTYAVDNSARDFHASR